MIWKEKHPRIFKLRVAADGYSSNLFILEVFIS